MLVVPLSTRYFSVLSLATSVESELVEQLLTAFRNKTPEKELAILLDTSVLESFPDLFHNRGGNLSVMVFTSSSHVVCAHQH